VSWELGFGIFMAVVAVVALATIIVLMVFGARKDGQRHDEVQAEIQARGTGDADGT
jgi:uncharacterized membrane protein